MLTPLRRAAGLFLPPRCLGCGLVVGQDHAFCPDCWGGLTFIGSPRCRRCGVPFELAVDSDMDCAACLERRPLFNEARAALVYDALPRTVLMRFKHGGRPHMARMMARHMRLVADDWLADGNNLLLPVPLARWRLWRRGYNQAGLLAAELAKTSAASLRYDVLIRHRGTAPSVDLSAKKRRANVRGAFSVAATALECLRDRPVILVDDVLTSGATADACSQVLLAAGAQSVRVLTWARTLSS